LRDQIDALGRAPGEHDLVRARRADKIGHALPGFFVMLGRTHAQRMQATMHVGVFVLVIISDDVEHGTRLLRAGSAIEVNQGMTVHALPVESENLRGSRTNPPGLLAALCMRQSAPTAGSRQFIPAALRSTLAAVCLAFGQANPYNLRVNEGQPGGLYANFLSYDFSLVFRRARFFLRSGESVRVGLVDECDGNRGLQLPDVLPVLF